MKANRATLIRFSGVITDHNALASSTRRLRCQPNVAGKNIASVENRVEVNAIPHFQVGCCCQRASVINVGARIEEDFHFSAAEYLHRQLIAYPVHSLNRPADQAGLGGRKRRQIGEQAGWINGNVRIFRYPATGVTEDRVVVGAEDAESEETTDCEAVACAYASDPRITPANKTSLANLLQKNLPIAIPALFVDAIMLRTQ